MPRTATRPESLDVQCALQFAHYVNALSVLGEMQLRRKLLRVESDIKNRGSSREIMAKKQAVLYCLAVELEDEPPTVVSLKGG